MELPSLADRVCLVTGANSGIGKATAEGLASQGATVIMVSRDRQRGEEARKEIVNASENNRIDLLLADLSSQAEVRGLAQKVRDEYDRLDVLVNNAAITLARRQLTEDGIEKTMAVNYLAPFLLTNLLIDLLDESAPSRIINVTSDSHRQVDLDVDDLQSEASYQAMQVYSRSKLALVLFTYELARRLRGTGVTVNCVHPGVVRTNIWRKEAGWLSWITGWFSWLFRSPKDGAKPVLYLAASPEVEDVTGQYFKRTRQARSSDQSYDEQLAAKLWEKSEELTGL